MSTGIVLQLLAGIAGIVFVTACITKICLEFMYTPVISTDEWKIDSSLGGKHYVTHKHWYKNNAKGELVCVRHKFRRFNAGGCQLSGCGKLFKGTHKDDDAIPCGTNLTFGVGREPQVTEVWLCDKCALTYENGEEAKP